MSPAVPSLTQHARQQILRRNLDDRVVYAVASVPDEVIPLRPGREIRQSTVLDTRSGKTYLVRVVIDFGPDGATIVTAYRTSKLAKYASPA